MLATFYKHEISQFDRHVPFIQFEVINDLISAKDEISMNDYRDNLIYILTSDMDDIEHYVDSNSTMDLKDYLKINVFFIKNLFKFLDKDLKKDSRAFYVGGNFSNLLNSYDDEHHMMNKKFIKFMKLEVIIYMDSLDYDDKDDINNIIGSGTICSRKNCVIM